MNVNIIGRNQNNNGMIDTFLMSNICLYLFSGQKFHGIICKFIFFHVVNVGVRNLESIVRLTESMCYLGL